MDPYAPTRFGSVADLARLAGGADLATAAAAWRQLGLMVNDDSRQVAAAASAALDDLALRVSAASVDLGELKVGARSPSTEVKIEGPPLAAASRVESSQPNVRIRRTERTLHVEVDTSKAGRVEGHLKIDGPTGSVDVLVTAVVVGDAAVAPIRSSVPLAAAAASERANAAEAVVTPTFPDPTLSPTRSTATAAEPDSTTLEGAPPGTSPGSAGCCRISRNVRADLRSRGGRAPTRARTRRGAEAPLDAGAGSVRDRRPGHRRRRSLHPWR